MQPGQGHVIRLAISLLVLCYLTGDLLVLHGPLQRWLWPAPVATGDAPAAVARVAHYPITRPQLDRAVAERLWLEGKVPGDLTADQLKQMRHAVLNDLIDRQLLRAAVEAIGAQLPVAGAEIDAAMQRFRARFATQEELGQALKHDGIAGEPDLRLRLAAGLQQVQFLESRLAAASTVSDDEARAWFERHAAELARPERVRARHLFLATLERDPAAAEAKLTEALGQLARKEADFAELAAALSEDERSKGQGGDLGWFSRTRLPADFTTPVFGLTTGTHALVRTKLGWQPTVDLEAGLKKAIAYFAGLKA